jgi:hypothetical protein
LPPQFIGIALLKDLRLERNGLGQKANVIAILLAVSFELGEGQIVRVELSGTAATPTRST